MPIEDYKHRAEVSLQAVLKNPGISKSNKENLQLFLDAKERSDARKDIINRHIMYIFLESGKEGDITKSMRDIKQVSSIMKRVKSKTSISNFETIKNVGKSFVRFFNDDETPKGWKYYKSNKKLQRRNLKEKDMISWLEIENLAATDNSIQLRAIIELQGEGGFRPSEFIDLDYGDIELKGSFAIITVREGKTGGRDVIVYKCASTLQNWLEKHPSKTKNSPLWIQEHGTRQVKRYEYPALLKRIREIGKRANFKKPLDFYALRHSACYQAKMENMPTDEAAKNFGHSVEYFVNTYGRLGVSDRLQRHEKHRGILKEENEAKSKQSIKCIKCSRINKPGVKKCLNCGYPLTMEAALEMSKETQSLRQELEKQAKIQALLIKALAAPNNKKAFQKIMQEAGV